MTLDDEEVVMVVERKVKACEHGWCVRDILRRVPAVGHLGDVELQS